MTRFVCHFSCGAASAVATKFIVERHRGRDEILIVNAFLKEEHPDNQRFLKDCEKWFHHKITTLKDEKYSASAYELFRKRRFIKNRNGAPCSRLLKKELLETVSKPGDVTVLGYTKEEEKRFDRFLDANAELEVVAPLIDHGMGKADCLAMIERAGIRLPAMYGLGYHNANCIGCVKGGQGYWNKIRVDFPEIFEEMAGIEALIGPGAFLFRDRKTGKRYPLTELDPNSGRYVDEPDISCSFHCELLERNIELPPWEDLMNE